MNVGAVALQPELPLLLYSTVALASTPPSTMAPLLVILSIALEPVSAVNATVGTAMLVSSAKLSTLDDTLTLPDASV